LRVTLIHNPGAGDDKQPSRGQLEALIREAGHDVRYQSVREKGWAKVLDKKVDLVAVAGGDGTVGKVARRLIKSGLPIAVLPMGTANNISRTLGIADLSVFELIPSWSTSRQVRFDTGIATGPWGERRFIEAVGFGLFTEAIPHIDANETMAQLNDVEVKLSYTIQLLREHLDDCPATKVKATLDGKDISGGYILVEAMLTQFVGPNLYLAPKTVADDGLFDAVVVKEKDRDKLHDHLENWQDGMLWPSELKTRRGEHLTIEWTDFPLHIDDKVWPEDDGKKKKVKKEKKTTTIDITVERKSLEFAVPKHVEKTS
jgi:diacylglycerol kinase family enzyme